MSKKVKFINLLVCFVVILVSIFVVFLGNTKQVKASYQYVYDWNRHAYDYGDVQIIGSYLYYNNYYVSRIISMPCPGSGIYCNYPGWNIFPSSSAWYINASVPSCSCSGYYAGSCSGSNRYYYRYCSPSGCSSEGYWAYDPSCTPPPPTLSFYASPNPINQGGCTYLWWNSSNTSSLYAYWLGYYVGVPSGSAYVCPWTSTSYAMGAFGSGGSITGYATVSVIVPPPPPQIINFYANPSSIYVGNSSMLYWTHQNASYGYVCGDQIGASNNSGGYGCLYTNYGTYPNYGGASASPSAIGNHQYSLTMYNSSGNATTAYTNINVMSPPPVLNFWPSSYTVNQGSCTYLNWNSQYVNNIWSYWLSGYVSSPSGFTSVCPYTTTTYSIIGYGPGGSTSRSVTISVMPPAPYVTLDAIPISINKGQPVTLVWRSTNADRILDCNFYDNKPCQLNYNQVNGSNSYYPLQDKTYTITVGDAYGRTYPASVNVRVNQAKELSGIFISKKINFVSGSYIIKQDSKTVSNTPPGFSELLAPIWKELIP